MEISVEFAEAVYATSDTITLLGDDGQTWPLADVAVRKAVVRARVAQELPPGGYTVVARPRSATNHVLDATVHFAIAGAQAPPLADHSIIAPHAPEAGVPSAAVAALQGTKDDRATAARAVELLGLAVVAGGSVTCWRVVGAVFRRGPWHTAVLAAGMFAVIGGRLAATPLLDIAAASGRLQVALGLNVLSAVAVVGFLLAQRHRAATAAAVPLVLGSALGGHGDVLAFVHLAAASVWLGTLVAAVLAVPGLPRPERAALVRRASVVCGAAFFAALLSGIARFPFSTALRAEYWDTFRGKSLALLVAAALAGLSLLALRRTQTSLRVICVEAAALTTAVALAAALGTTPRDFAERSVRLEAVSPHASARLDIAPGTVGRNELSATACDGFAPGASATVSFRHPNLGISTPASSLRCDGEPAVTVLAVPGVWEAVVWIPGPTAVELSTRFQVPESH